MFKLSRLLGGRKEVLESPADQILKYFDMRLSEEEEEFERERSKLWLSYLAQIFSQPSTGQESVDFKRAKDQYIDLISPKEKTIPAPKEYKWDFDESLILENTAVQVSEEGE